jgi:hypothetical protein
VRWRKSESTSPFIGMEKRCGVGFKRGSPGSGEQPSLRWFQKTKGK